jgi:hypothetical protein
MFMPRYGFSQVSSWHRSRGGLLPKFASTLGEAGKAALFLESMMKMLLLLVLMKISVKVARAADAM